MAYVDETFYNDDYKGFLMPSTSFDYYAERATEELDTYITGEVDPDDIPDSVKLCTCSVADILYKVDNPDKDAQAKASESVGSYKVSFNTSASSKDATSKKIYDSVNKYLGKTGLIYRGVANVY